MIKVLIAAFLGAVFAQPPPVLQFSSPFQFTSKTSLGGGGGFPSMMPRVVKTLESNTEFAPHAKIFETMLAQSRRFKARQGFDLEVTLTGDFTYDALNGRQRMDIKTLATSMPGFSQPAVTLEGDNFEILRYDLGKNLTKVSVENNGKCSCTDLTGDIMPYYLPPDAVSSGAETITINGQKVATTKYNLDFPMAGVAGVSASLSVWTDPVAAGTTSYARRCYVKFSMDSVSISMTLDLSNPKKLDNVKSDVFLPTDCTCPTAPVIPAIPEAVKALTCSATFTPATGCTCLKKTKLDAMAFCGSIVTWPIDGLIDPVVTDTFVQTAYSAVSNAANCKGLKEFMCKFYFGICAEKKDVYQPESAPDCPETSSLAANAKYNSGIKISSGDDDKSSSSTLAVSIALALGSLAVFLF